MLTLLIIALFLVVPAALGAGIAELMIRHAKRQARLSHRANLQKLAGMDQPAGGKRL